MSNVTLLEKRLRQQLNSVNEITVLGTSPRITYELWNVNSIRGRCWNIATNEREVDYWKYEVIMFVVEFFFIFRGCRFQGKCISSNLPASPAYGVYISQLIRYSRACAQYSDFIDRVQLLTEKLLKQGCIAHRLKSSLQTSTVINTKYSHLKLHWIFYLLRRFYLSSITVKTFNELIYIYE
jgi:hypothetical protein